MYSKTKAQKAAELERKLANARRSARTLLDAYDDAGDEGAVEDLVSILAWFDGAMRDSLRGRRPTEQIAGQLRIGQGA